MLDLLRTFTGSPSGLLQHLVLPHTTLVLYSSADTVVVLNAASLQLIRVLAFQEVFPGLQSLDERVSCIAVDPAMKIIMASINTHIAAWSMSDVQTDTWRVHSSLVLPDGDFVTALDCRSGLLAVGSQSGLSVYTLILENDLLTWSKKWGTRVVTPSLAKLAPTLTYIATTSFDDNRVRLYSTTSGKQTQGMPHPRPVESIVWRYSPMSRSGDPTLFTITSDSVLRIFLPVVDSPQRLQLHLAVDILPSAVVPSVSQPMPRPKSEIIWLDREVIGPAVKAVLKASEIESVETSRLRDVDEKDWDLFLRVLVDGSLLLSAVANIDRKPPTLLRQFTVSHSLRGTLFPPPLNLYILPCGKSGSLTLVTSPPLRTHNISATTLLNGRADSLQLVAAGPERMPLEESKILRFVRTPAGRGVAVVRADGGETWMETEGGHNLARLDSWPSADQVVVLDGGKLVATYSSDNAMLTLHSTPPSTLRLPRVSHLFSTPSRGEHESIVALTEDKFIFHIHVSGSPHPTLMLHSHNRLPLSQAPKRLIAVDPMAWSKTSTLEEHDNLLSVSDDGELCFWTLEHGKKTEWRCTGRVRTGRSGFGMVSCSSAKKSVLVSGHPDGQELTIWDSNESEFASGLEHQRIFSASEPIYDLDWTSTPDNQSILAVGFAQHVELLCQQRKTYFGDDPAWTICFKIEIGRYIPYTISDSIWLANGTLLVGVGHHMFLYGQTQSYGPNSTTESLFVHVARINGPLPDYHPQMLLQCLLWGKISLVKRIIISLRQATRGGNTFRWQPFAVEDYLEEDQSPITKRPARWYGLLFGSPEKLEPVDEVFSRSLVESLIEQLEGQPLPHLSPNEHAHLIVLIQTTLEIDEQRRALDANGLRYVLSMRSFYILNRRIVSDPGSPRSGGGIPHQTGWRERLRYRDMIWAFHSESQDLLLNTSTAACNGKMLWADARALGIFIWLTSVDTMKSHMEIIARNEYMAGGNRDPTTCSLFYFALGKVKLVHGLWRQAAWHKEQTIMLKFLANDFTQSRWKTAALKNAYTLMGKQRFEYAAAFFLLGGSLKDAVNVCLKQLSDFQLAVALARVFEGNDGQVLGDILNNTILPIAFREGNRWLGSWAFWLLRRRDLSVRILLTPLRDLADSLEMHDLEIGEPHFDDPSLALLFSQLRSKTLQAAAGTSEISGRREYNFILQVARVFCRMGCHALALYLVRSWSFERPTTAARNDAAQMQAPPSPISPRRTLTNSPFLRRRSSILIDMDVESKILPGRQTPESGPRGVAQETIKEESDLAARKAGLGSLIKSAKQDVQVPEFNMDAFSDSFR
ncbi:RAVE protein 1 C terminal-domain-containing protein [Butyriboletus roseoflavus]|nr:RAVE protein 1 C terminal-domain-containing protein [Butyriboletus roseoflavus]